MSETKHTPGPWKAVAVHEEGHWDVETVATRGGSRLPVVCVAQAIDEEADARLIAAAPELLALARLVSEELDASGTRWEGTAPGLEELGRSATALIAKAEGR